MRQILFTIPVFKNWFPPDGIPVYGFGAMLFLTFIIVTWWGGRRAQKVGLPPERFQDLAVWLFISGIAGARVLYMIQYADDFPEKSALGLIGAFFQIWRGGIIFYGSALGGAFGYGLFYWYVLRRLKINGWQLADAVAPLLALGLAIGRIGCYLNGCCWGQVACEGTCPVPLGAAHFPLLPAHARKQLVDEKGLQTSTGFALVAPPRGNGDADDPRGVVAAVEVGSPAAAAGLLAGDRIVRVNGQPNAIVLEISGPADKVSAALDLLRNRGGKASPADPASHRPASVAFDRVEEYRQARQVLDADHSLSAELTFSTDDLLGEMVRFDWPRGKSDLELGVLRDGKEIELPPFSPLTVGLYPTQLYETVSMVLLIGVLLAYYPFRRHDGQLMVLVMIGYSLHRFLNESLRIEPAVGQGLTLSQWGSVVIFAAAVGIEVFLWWTMPSRWKATTQEVAHHG